MISLEMFLATTTKWPSIDSHIFLGKEIGTAKYLQLVLYIDLRPVRAVKIGNAPM